MASSSVLFISILLFLVLVHAADPDPLQDFCIRSSSTSQQCKAPTPADFSSELLRGMTNHESPGGFSATLANVDNFPALNTQGLSFARADLGVGGTVPLHIHPRATELIYAEEGTIEAGFIDGNNKLFARTLKKGDLFLIPRGLLHYQYNVGKVPSSGFATFNSQNPGLQIMGPALFGSGIRDEVLAASLGLNQSTIKALRKKFHPSS